MPALPARRRNAPGLPDIIRRKVEQNLEESIPRSFQAPAPEAPRHDSDEARRDEGPVLAPLGHAVDVAQGDAKLAAGRPVARPLPAGARYAGCL